MAARNVGVVGAGIVGLAHAWSAAERGHRVTVFERSSQACGASIRNFGMVWPIGQSAGDWHSVAIRSRQRWMKLAAAAPVWIAPCGSIHLAHRADEWAVLQEFDSLAANLGFECTLLNAEQVLDRTPAANPKNLRGGLLSPTEMCVNPGAAIRSIPTWLSSEFQVQFEFSNAITDIDSDSIGSADGRRWEFDRIIVCCGADFATLFPRVLADSGMKLCKLQMLKTCPQPTAWRMGPHLASGLTLRHYRNFEVCRSLSLLKQRIAAETPELDRYGIHVMASQDDSGCVVLGDSHEYDSEIEPFDKSLIDDLILRELRSVIAIPEWTISQRWNGVYAKHADAPVFAAEPIPNVFIRTGTGGSGMTMAFGLAELDWEKWE